MKTIFVTGANRGLGFEIARQAGRKGAFVIISGRDRDKLSETLKRLQVEKIPASMVVVDVSSGESIKNAAKTLASAGTMIDVIMNNAGIGPDEDRSLVKDDISILLSTITTNSIGPLLIVKAFLPFLKTPGRIINISSGGGSMSDPVGGWSPGYCASKTFLNAITRHLAFELSGKNISVNAVCPGWVRTDMGGSSAPRSVEKGAETPVWLAMEAPQEMTGKFLRDKKVIPW